MFEGWDGSEAGRGTATTATAQPDPAARPAVPVHDGADVLAGPLTTAGQALHAARQAADTGQLYRVGSTQVTEHLAAVDHLRHQADQLTLALVIEASTRGLQLDEQLSWHDWLTRLLPTATRSQINDLALIAHEVHTPGHEPIREHLLDGSLTPARAAKVLRVLRPIRVVTDPVTYAADTTTLVSWAARPDVNDKELAVVAETLLTAALPREEAEARDKTQHDLRGVNESSLADGSLTRFIITADPEGAALLRAVLTSPLAAPSPDATGPDPRTATQRRYDALLTVLGRGVTSPDGVPTTSKARVMVTIPLTVLQKQTEQAGLTLTGDLLPAATLRKLACSAELIPAVLGTDSEILDLARPIRYASPGQLTALYHRDRHCTYPGCTIPAQWCDAHHVTWYSRGGKTYYLNLALLCGRHHTLVHRHDLTATITPTGVTWHLK
jgi:hypothetical protein